VDVPSVEELGLTMLRNSVTITLNGPEVSAQTPTNYALDGDGGDL
jgi:hypothetical protein